MPREGTVDEVGEAVAFLASSGHRANVLGAYNRVGVGAARDAGGQLWVAVVLTFPIGFFLSVWVPPYLTIIGFTSPARIRSS